MKKNWTHVVKKIRESGKWLIGREWTRNHKKKDAIWVWFFLIWSLQKKNCYTFFLLRIGFRKELSIPSGVHCIEPERATKLRGASKIWHRFFFFFYLRPWKNSDPSRSWGGCQELIELSRISGIYPVSGLSGSLSAIQPDITVIGTDYLQITQKSCYLKT